MNSRRLTRSPRRRWKADPPRAGTALLAPFRDRPLDQITVRAAGPQVSFEGFKQVTGHGDVATFCPHSVDQDAPIGNNPFALCNLPIGILQVFLPHAGDNERGADGPQLRAGGPWP